MNMRVEALRSIGKQTRRPSKSPPQFGVRVFHRERIQELPRAAAQNWLDVLDQKARFDPEHADAIAEGLKNWALQHGATHYTHWFQPLTNAAAEKHDSFLSWGPEGTILEKFRGKELMRGEPDASSFPSGGLRATHEARGYTVWDPTVFPFLWEGGDGLILCIPSFFFSFRGEALDHRIPLLRSEEKLTKAVLKLLNFCGEDSTRVFSTLGFEQEYFVIDRSLFLLRPDLFLAGRTVFGAKPSKGQELEDHYFGSVKDRVMAFMREFEEEALKIGIPLKTRHNEVAPAQHEVAPLFEKAAFAVDHNILLMELMRRVAEKHDLACLLHEKPFKGLNGSGKHCNWSIATAEGLNLLDPQENSLVFIILLTAVLRGVHEHAALLRASISSSGNDYRLGGAEAPPTILSVYLGDVLEKIIEGILQEKKEKLDLKSVDLGLMSIPKSDVDGSDRNRTSFFAFTGNKFEFRAVGASAHCALPISVINSIVADSLELILDEIKGQKEAVFPVLKKHLSASKSVVFAGNNYSSEWEKEAEARGLPNIRKSYDAFAQFLQRKALGVFEKVLSEEELKSRYEICVEQYAKTVQIEANLMIELFQTQILPAAQKDMLQRGIKEPLIDEAIQAASEIKKLLLQMQDMGWEAKGKILSELGTDKMENLRRVVDELEMVVDNALWPLPKYRELLFLV